MCVWVIDTSSLELFFLFVWCVLFLNLLCRVFVSLFFGLEILIGVSGVEFSICCLFCAFLVVSRLLCVCAFCIWWCLLWSGCCWSVAIEVFGAVVVGL